MNSDHNIGLDEPTITFLTLVSNDNQEFEIETKYCNVSDYLKHMIALDSSTSRVPIDTPGVLLEIIVNFLKHYPEEEFHRIQKPVPKEFNNSKFIHDDKKDVFEVSFYTELLKDKNINFVKLVHIVHYLAIQPMLELVCARIANIVRDMTKEEEMKYLNISEDEYIEMKKTNDWAKN